MIKILENLESDTKTITITVNDSEGQLAKLLDDIKKTAATGHTFEVVVDPNDEKPRAYEIDGDGAFRIDDIKSEKVTTEALEPHDVMNLSDEEGKVTELDTIALKHITNEFTNTLNELLTHSDELSKLYPEYIVDDEPPYFDNYAFVAYKVDSKDYFFSEGVYDDKYTNIVDAIIEAIKKQENGYSCKDMYMEYNRALQKVKSILNKIK